MPKLEISSVIQADKRTIYELLKLPENFPHFMDDIEEITLLERGPGLQLSEWHGLLDDAPVEWRQEDRFDDEMFQIWFEGFEGDFDEWKGEWRMEDTSGGVNVTLELHYMFDLPTLQELLMPIIGRKIRANAEMMLRGLQEQAERTSASDQTERVVGAMQ